jgi:hypothetical protein
VKYFFIGWQLVVLLMLFSRQISSWNIQLRADREARLNSLNSDKI